MKIRIKFTKQGDMRFIGHLDFMRFFQKVIRRAGIDIAFSEGISPHMIMSFASPLGVGLTSEGDYVDIQVGTTLSAQEALARLNASSTPDVRFLDYLQVEEGKAGKAMSIVAAADYEVTIDPPAGAREESDSLRIPDPQEKLRSFLAQDTIMITRQKKKALKKAGKKAAGRDSGMEQTLETIDIRPMIHEASCDPSGLVYRLWLSSGSAANLRPEQVMSAFAAYCGLSLPPFCLKINRKDLLAVKPGGCNDAGTGAPSAFVPLSALGVRPC